MFDVMVKRLNEYKRQLLKALHIIWLYHRIKANPQMPLPPRTFIFGAKAAPGYFLAKRIIKLIHCLAQVIHDDPDVNGRLCIVFPANFNVAMAERIYPAADLSEQISLAGKEASGTGNMKFALNGAVIIGTLDGANVEIREQIGAANFFQFGLEADQALRLAEQGYNPQAYYQHDGELKAAIDAIAMGLFSGGDKDLLQPIVESLLGRDEFMLLADFRSYVAASETAAYIFQDRSRWTRMSILNTARSGFFSSDRTIREYCDEIWHVKPLPVK
jgi:starch phosphorylase